MLGAPIDQPPRPVAEGKWRARLSDRALWKEVGYMLVLGPPGIVGGMLTITRTVAGGLNLTVPDVSYALHASSGVGHVSDGGVRVDPASPRAIDARSSVGSVAITVGR